MAKFYLPTAFTYEQIEASYTGDISALNNMFYYALSLEPIGPGPTRGPLTRWCGYYFGKPRMEQPEALALLPLQPGDPNPFFTVIDTENNGKARLVTRGDSPEALASMEVDSETWLKTSRIMMVVAAGGDAENLPVWFAVDLTAEVPEGFPNRMITEEVETVEGSGTFTEVTRARTWGEWHDSSHSPTTINGQGYVAGNSWGEELLASVWYPHAAAGTLSVLSLVEYKAILAAANPEVV